MKRIVFSFLSVFSFSQAALAADNASYEGTYNRTNPAASTMTVSKSGDQWLLHINGGGIPNGAATAADCEIKAKGEINNNILTAKLLPNYPGDKGIPYATNTFKIKFSKNNATVIEQDVSGCGMGSDLGGTYRKAQEAKILGRTDKVAYECPSQNAALSVSRDVEVEYQKNKFEDPSVTLKRHMCKPVPKGTPFYSDEKKEFSFDSDQWVLVKGKNNYMWVAVPNNVD